ncbi:Melanoma-associated antigen D2 [Podila epicladia]|nr:Melanoma-associated antigen D2 [Podila epicladia]KAG0097459.1 Melanoma-associated antigen D2 [Podila epicladia]
MYDKRRTIIDDDEEGYTQRGSSSSKRGAPSSPVAGSQKRVMRNDSDEEDYAPAPIRRTTTTTNSSASLLDNIIDENARDDIERKIKDVVRLAVFTSHSDSSLKREDIKKVVGDVTPKMFDAIFQKAQERLRDVFGMELVELTTKGRSGNNAEKGSKAYILRNTLPLELVSRGMVDWEDELEDMGLLMVILSLIMVRQGVIYEKALMAHLRRMNLLSDESPLGDVSKLMDSYVKKRYIEKVKLEHMDDSGEKAEVELRWGARARVELSEENVVKFMKEVFGRDAPMGLEASIMKAAGIKANDTADQREEAEQQD